ncbi:MAG: HAMP domain-containing sensor histidine kinase [Thermoanaerobaculia bacterium]
MLHSVRARLTLWYCGVLAVVLVTFGSASYLRIARTIRAETDASLEDTAHELTAAFSQVAAEEEPSARAVPLDFRYSDRALFLFRPDGVVLAWSRPPQELNEGDRAAIGRRVAGGATGFFTVKGRRGDEGIRALALPITVLSKRFIAVVARDLNDQSARLRNAAESLWLGIPFALLVAGGGGYFLARESLAPVLRMSRKAREIGASNLGERIEVRNPRDELGILAATINGLLARLESAFALQRRFMAEASHELRTPLAILQGEADVALARPDRTVGEYREALEIVQKTSRKLAQIVEDLFLLSRRDAGNFPMRLSRFYLEETVADCARALRTAAAARGVRVSVEPSPECLVYGDEELIHRLVLNLLDNAIKFTRPGSSVRVDLERADGADRILVRDEGRGVSETDRGRIFERFYRGGGDGPSGKRGAGLGLAIAQSIAQLHAGDVRLVETSDGGSTFVAEIRVSLPPSG